LSALVAVPLAALALAALPVLLPQRGQQPWASALAFAGFVGLAALGLQLGFSAGWMLLTVVGALCAWDLEHLAERQSQPTYAASGAERAMEVQHLRRLLAVAVAGLLLGGAGLLLQVRITFLPAVLLSLLALLGLTWVVSFLRAWDE
jgi:hypothetical protein